MDHMSKSRNIIKFMWLGLLAIGTFAFVIGAFARSKAASADSGVLLTGTIASGGVKVEGVVVSARVGGSNITTSVYTDERGNYYFPRLDAGSYQVWAQAGGYAAGRESLELSGNSVKRQDFDLVALKSPEDMGKQMTGAEWMDSMPAETAADMRAKEILRDTCTGCHPQGLTFRNRFDAKGWEIMVSTMVHTGAYGNYIFNSPPAMPFADFAKKDLAAYLAKVRGPESVLTPKFRPRPTGEATLAVVREYAIPLVDTAKGLPPSVEDGNDWSLGTPSGLHGSRSNHDSTPDFYGNIWFTTSIDNDQRTYGKVNIKTGEGNPFQDSGAHGMALTSHQLLRDREGNIWMSLAGEVDGVDGPYTGIGKVDPKTDKLEIYTPPNGMPRTSAASGMSITKGSPPGSAAGHGAVRLDAKTHQFKAYTFKGGAGSPYGVTLDINGDGWGSQFSNELEARVDFETGETMDVQIPPPPRAERVKALFLAR